jgi:putative FmdB family regulatory protein
MPRFDFRCTACQTTFEESIAFGSTAFPACPACGSTKTEKQLAMPGIQFKGTGFYKTDSQSPAPSAAPKTEDKKKDPPAKTDASPSAPAPSPSPAA